jgi:hypothetical protein
VIAVAAAATGALAGAAGYAVAGPFGLLVVIVSAGVLALLTPRWRISKAPTGQARSDQVGRVNAAFSSYWRIESALNEGRASRRRFDLATRPMLSRLLAALLADRQRVDLVRDPDAARKAVGDDMWPLLDEARPPVTDPALPGITAATLTTIVDRLEEL